MSNGMGGLYVGVTGLQAAQAGLNTTAHNLANINTVGYTRQQITYSDTKYVSVSTASGSVGSYGLGVTVSQIKRVRDQFIDSAYRSENSRLGYYTGQNDAIEEIEDLFGETQGVSFQSSLTDLYSAINELSTEPESTIKRSSLIEYATAFIQRANSIYEGLKTYQTNLNTDVDSMVSTINDLASTIYSLNNSIVQVESTGLESANDLRDQRDTALDELSEYIDISYYETENGAVYVTAEGYPLVTPSGTMEMGTVTSSTNGLKTPVWLADNSQVFQDGETISTTKDNDKGKLKGVLTARGSVSVDYTDVPVKPDSDDYDLTTQEGQDAYNSALEEYQEKQDYYNTYIEPSSILSAMAGLDKLVNGIVEAINDILCPEETMTTTTALTDSSGNELQAQHYVYTSTSSTLYTRDGVAVTGTDNGDQTYTFDTDDKLYSDSSATTAVTADSYTYQILDMDETGYGMDDDQTVGQELFSRLNTERYVESTDASGNKIYVRNDWNTNGSDSSYTLGNIEVNQTLAQNTDMIELTTLQGGEDFTRAQQLVDIWSSDFASLNPDEYAVTDINEYYSNFIGEFATVGSIIDNYVTNEQTMVDGYDSQRQQIEGVSSDEELQKMIKYQQAYNAASRYITVVNEMLESLISSLGS